MSLFGSGSGSATPSSSGDIKTALLQQVQQEAAMSNARALIGKINENCFDACIPAPGSSLSSKESTCLSSCMEKYINMWNVTSRTYMARMSQESKKLGGDASAIATMGTM
ncbi:Mitochondrial import inner membrane translocase subunit tim13 [Penicillium macrosclerotiorum]|uniref:Mitochondrial import inner membrane translocase subunit tim13 n=1 Tax=Penicillium macrosclerotiorum TaxID=303699 RepID=UPI0025488477|nr:Mitochondrial import inner membrane translocase subunit tim13 [Penicillium macrosclerotiorum]KAJ5666714.1 Mitochondrial import inner membrane translocase subunit tim13 [Penicillium macrosclerotiorum]